MSAACFFCAAPIQPGDAVNLHHPVYKSQGGIETRPAHKGCHVAHHSNAGEFAAWGRIGGQLTALTRRWAFNLKNVRTNPAYDFDRSYYRALYAH
jgi:hypothetical protein